jgi:hypothetical protein
MSTASPERLSDNYFPLPWEPVSHLWESVSSVISTEGRNLKFRAL